MKNAIIKMVCVLVAFTAAFLFTGCKKDYVDPNHATGEQVFSTSQGLSGAVTGLQRVYTLSRASNLYNHITINGLTTNELIVVNPGNTAEVQLAAGGTAVDGNNSMLTTFWTNLNKVVYDADSVIATAKNLSDKGIASGLIAYADIFKALSIGAMSEFWQKVPAGIGINVTFIDRIEGYKKAIASLDEAITTIAANPISSTFAAYVPAGIDIINTLHALKARYSLFAGLYAQALAEVNLVDLTKKSTFNFDAQSLNPLYEIATSTNNVVQPIDSTLGLPAPLQPSATDGRVPFYTSINTTIAPRFRIRGFGDAATKAIPIYLPGEMILIKAEAYARATPPDLVNAVIELNKVVTKNNDIYGVNANQPAVAPVGQAAVLDEIYRQRSIELFMSGLKLEDMRRFNRPLSERRRNLMPYPLRERDNNPNTPPDPAF
jgi:hypothetical protein